MAEIYKLKDCPFCGHRFDDDDLSDAIYPTFRDRTLWQCGCVICTATVYGESEIEAVSEWNTRSTDN